MESIENSFVSTALIFLAGGALVTSAVCASLLRFWPDTYRGWDSGDLERKAQKRPVMRLGGLGVGVALVVVLLLATYGFGGGGSRLGHPLLLLGACLLFFAIGLLDDLTPTPAAFKLLLQIAAALVAYGLGFRIELVTEPFGGHSAEVGAFSLPLTVLWLIAIPNLINLVDGIDGVAGGVGISLVGTLAVVAWMGGDWFLFAICLGMVGALGGFLFFNLPSARVYLGDGGAYLIGAFVGLASISASQKGAVAGSLFVIVLALALPIADTVFAVLRRFFYGFPIWKADSEHIHHRLVTLGVRKGLVIGGMIATVAIFSLLGLSLVSEGGETWPAVLTASVIFALFLIRLLGYWGGPGALVYQVRRVLMTREKVRYAYALGLVLEHEIDRTPDRRAFWNDFARSLEKVGLFPVGAGEDTPDGMELLEVPLATGETWVLAHRRGNGVMHWGKVAACFLGPLSRAMHKWGAIPPSIGVTDGEKPTNLSLLSLDRDPLTTQQPKC